MRAVLVLVLAAAAVVGYLVLQERGAADRAARGEAAPAAEPEPPSAPAAEPEAPAATQFVAGRVVDEEEQPVAGAALRGRVWGGEKYRETGIATTSDAGGRFRFEFTAKLPWVEIRVRHADYQQESIYAEAGSEDTVIVLRRGVPVAVVVRTPEGEPVPDQTVGASAIRESEEGWSWLDPLEDTTTDAAGRARIGAVAPGTLRVNVDRPAYAEFQGSFDVVAGEPQEFEVVLDRGGAIEGRVTDPSGGPVAGARVHPWGDEQRVAETNAEGLYRLEAVKGFVSVFAEADGFGPGAFGYALGWGRSVPVAVRPGETVRGIDIALGAASRVRGRVVDEQGAPVAGATVYLLVNDAIPSERQATTDAAGRFVAGPFTLPQETSEANVTGIEAAGLHLDRPKPRPLAAGGEVDFGELVAKRLGTIRGRVLDIDGSPVRKGTVSAGYVNAAVAPDGAFELSGLPTGDVTVEARVPGDRRARPVTVHLETGATVEDVELRLEETFAIGGRVLTPDGKPRPGVDVAAIEPGTPPPWEWSSPHVHGRTMTDGDGAFLLPGLFAGEYTVAVTEWEDAKLQPVRPPEPVLARAGGPELELVVPLSGGVLKGKVVSKRTGLPVRKFRARFWRYRLFVPYHWESESFDDAGGAFSYEVSETGSWAVEISADGHAKRRTKTFDVGEGDVVDVGEIQLGDAGAIHGVVRDHAGRPVDFARIHILNALIQTNWGAPYTNGDGAYEIRDVSPGRYNVFVVSPRHPLAVVRDVEVAEGGRTRVDVRLQASAPLTIRVVDDAGRPLPGAKLVWTFDAIKPLDSSMAGSYEPPGYGANVSDAEGIIRKPFLAAGPVDLRLEAEGFRVASRTVELVAGKPLEVEIRLERK